MPNPMPLVARKTRKAAGAAARPARNGDIRLGALADFIGFHLLLAQNASFRAFARHSGQPDLKPGRFAALMVIRNNPGITQVALGRAISRDKSTITPLVQELRFVDEEQLKRLAIDAYDSHCRCWTGGLGVHQAASRI